MDCKIGVVAFFGFQEVRESFFVPAVEVGPLGPVSICPCLAFKFGEPNLLENVVQGVLLHFEHPDQIAHEQVDIGSEAVDAGSELAKSQLQGVSRSFWRVSETSSNRAQARFHSDLVVPGIESHSNRAGADTVLAGACGATDRVIQGLGEHTNPRLAGNVVRPGLSAVVDVQNPHSFSTALHSSCARQNELLFWDKRLERDSFTAAP